jgi:hypothetical protein
MPTLGSPGAGQAARLAAGMAQNDRAVNMSQRRARRAHRHRLVARGHQHDVEETLAR